MYNDIDVVIRCINISKDDGFNVVLSIVILSCINPGSGLVTSLFFVFESKIYIWKKTSGENLTAEVYG